MKEQDGKSLALSFMAGELDSPGHSWGNFLLTF